MSSINQMGTSVEFPFLSLHLISHPLSGIFFSNRFDLGNFWLSDHSPSQTWIPQNALLVLKRWMGWSFEPHGFYIISFLILCLLIYDALRPRPLNGIPTSGRYCWALGDSGALYRHMVLSKTRTSGLGTHIVVLADGHELLEVCSKRSREFPDPGLTLDIYKGIIPVGQLALTTGRVFKHHRRA